MTPGCVQSVNLAVPVVVGSGRRGRRSGIGKRPVTGPVNTGEHQLVGDFIGNRRHHGGPDKALYAYAREDAAWWAAELDRELLPGSFGENLSTLGTDVTGAVIGEHWAIGTAVFEVSCPRIPCDTFAAHWRLPGLVARFTAAGRPGAYLRIVRPGAVRAGDELHLISRPDHAVTIVETFRALTGDSELLPRLLDAPQLPEQAHRFARRRLARVC